MFNNFFFFLNLALYQIMWKNIVDPERPQMTTWLLRIACWIPKGIDTHSECHLFCFSTATMFARKRRTVTLDLHCLSCLILELDIANWVKCKVVLVLNYAPRYESVWNSGCINPYTLNLGTTFLDWSRKLWICSVNRVHYLLCKFAKRKYSSCQKLKSIVLRLSQSYRLPSVRIFRLQEA